MNLGDKGQRITLRLNDNQFNFVKDNADVLGVSPSEFLRMVINTTMAGYRRASEIATQQTIKELKDGLSNVEGGLGRENDKANINN